MYIGTMGFGISIVGSFRYSDYRNVCTTFVFVVLITFIKFRVCWSMGSFHPNVILLD